MKPNDNNELLTLDFGEEFFAISPIEFADAEELGFPLPNSAEMLRSLLSRNKNDQHEKHQEFIAGIIKIINALDAWRMKHGIVIKVFDENTNAYREVNPCQRLIETYLEYDGNDSGLNGINLPFYRDGIPLLAKMLVILNSEQVPLSIRIDKIKHLLENINVCGPGAVTNIQDTYMELTAGADLRNKLRLLRRQIAEQVVIELIKPISTINPGMHIHYINGVINRYHAQLALDPIEDRFIRSCEPLTLQRLSNDFELKINSSLTVDTILTLLVDHELSELEDFIKASHEGKDKRNVAEILDDFGKKLLFYGAEDGAKSIYNIPDMLCMDATTCAPLKPERLSWYARDIITASIYQRLCLRNVFNSDRSQKIIFGAKVDDTDQPNVIMHYPQSCWIATMVEQPHLSGGLTPYLPFMIQGLCAANPRALEIFKFFTNFKSGIIRRNVFANAVIPAIVRYFNSTEFTALEKAEQENQIACIMSRFFKPEFLSLSNIFTEVSASNAEAVKAFAFYYVSTAPTPLPILDPNDFVYLIDSLSREHLPILLSKYTLPKDVAQASKFADVLCWRWNSARNSDVNVKNKISAILTVIITTCPKVYDELFDKGWVLKLIQLPLYTPQEHMERICALPDQGLQKLALGNFDFIKTILAAFPLEVRVSFIRNLINKGILSRLCPADVKDIVNNLPALDKVKIILMVLDKNACDGKDENRFQVKALFFDYFKLLTPSDRKKFFEGITALEAKPLLALSTEDINRNFDPLEYASLIKKIPLGDRRDQTAAIFICGITHPDIRVRVAVCKELLPVMEDAELGYFHEILKKIPYDRVAEIATYHQAFQPLFNRENLPNAPYYNYHINQAFHLCLYKLPAPACMKLLEAIPSSVIKYALRDGKTVVGLLSNSNPDCNIILTHLLNLGHVEEVVRGFHGACLQAKKVDQRSSLFQNCLLILLNRFNETIISKGKTVNSILDDKFFIDLLPPNEEINYLLYMIQSQLHTSSGAELLMLTTRAYCVQRTNDQREHTTVPFFSPSRTDKIVAANYLMMLLQDLHQPTPPINNGAQKALQQGKLGELYKCYLELRVCKGLSPSP